MCVTIRRDVRCVPRWYRLCLTLPTIHDVALLSFYENSTLHGIQFFYWILSLSGNLSLSGHGWLRHCDGAPYLLCPAFAFSISTINSYIVEHAVSNLMNPPGHSPPLRLPVNFLSQQPYPPYHGGPGPGMAIHLSRISACARQRVPDLSLHFRFMKAATVDLIHYDIGDLYASCLHRAYRSNDELIACALFCLKRNSTLRDVVMNDTLDDP